MDETQHSKLMNVLVKTNTATEEINVQEQSVGLVLTRIGPFVANYTLSRQQMNLLRSIERFFDDEKIETFVRPLITQNGTISLRTLDWLCTNLSKSRNLICVDKYGRKHSIYSLYKLALSTWRRRLFDPFRRKLRIVIEHPNGDIESTVGQLNYLKWVFETGIYQYALEHAAMIEKNMTEVTTKSRKRKRDAASNGQTIRRNELTKTTTKFAVYVDDFSLTNV